MDFNAEIKVKRSGTDDSAYSDSATVAAGGKSTSEHQADVQVTAKDSDGNPMSGISVDAPTIQNKEGEETAASISPSSATTDSNGKANFTFTSSDIAGNVTLEEDGGVSSASASISQSWTQDLDGGNWEYDEYFDYDTPSDIIFIMALDSGETIPITDHDIRFVNTEVSGWEWNPAAGEDWDEDGYPDGGYEYRNQQNYDVVKSEYGDLVTYGAVSKSGGDYTTQQVISSNEDFWVDEIYFDAVDWDAY